MTDEEHPEESAEDESIDDDFAAEADVEEWAHRSIAREDVIKLTVVGVILLIVGGLGSWYSKWDTSPFAWVDVANDRAIFVPHTCRAETRLAVEEFEDRVEIALTQRPPSEDCDALPFRCVELERPLAGREIVNSGTGDVVLVDQLVDFECDDEPGFAGRDGP